MPDVVLRVENLSKRFRIVQREAYARLSEVPGRMLASAASRLRRTTAPALPADPARDEAETLWALRDVSFEVRQGEVVGIVGRNGAGKSTLLKILSRITKPTSGQVSLRGRVGSLLEVGTGFHPELTGRENIYLNGAILGMRRREIDRKFDEIVAFAEVDRFLDTPVKHYSSGMHMRLAFAVAAHLEPEILIVDEVLAVGDAQFQKKCLGKMQDVAGQGRTVLFVSHNTVAVQSLSSKAFLLAHGAITRQGSAQDVIRHYISSMATDGPNQELWPTPSNAPGTHRLKLRKVAVYPENDGDSFLTMTTAFVVEIDYWVIGDTAQLHLGLRFITELDVVAFTSGNFVAPEWQELCAEEGLFRTRCHVPANLMNCGLHRLVLFFLRDGMTVELRHECEVTVNIRDAEAREIGIYCKDPGAVQPLLSWELEKLGKVEQRDPAVDCK